MFLTNKEYNLDDFLTSLSFIAPKGTTVAYFITPRDIGIPAETGYQPKLLDIPPDESQVYVQKPPVQKQDQGVTPAEYSTFDPPELGRRQPTPNILPPVTEPEDLQSPFVQILSESRSMGTDVKLLEDYRMFPKGTIFHCVGKRLDEGRVDPDDEAFWIRSNGERVRRPIADGYTARMEAYGKPTVADMGGLSFADAKPGELDFLGESTLKETATSDKYEKDKGWKWKFQPHWMKAEDLEQDIRWLFNAHHTPEEILEILSSDPDYKKRWKKFFDHRSLGPLDYIKYVCGDHADRQRFRSENKNYAWDEKKRQYNPTFGEEDFPKEDNLMKNKIFENIYQLTEASLPKQSL